VAVHIALSVEGGESVEDSTHGGVVVRETKPGKGNVKVIVRVRPEEPIDVADLGKEWGDGLTIALSGNCGVLWIIRWE
jgi:hypothetical protein